MSEPGQGQLVRPRQVTMAGWMIILGSGAVVLTVFSLISGLNSFDTRESIERVLSEPPGNGLGLDVESARSALRIVAMVAAASATAAGILGWQVLQRSRSARVGLAVIAVPLFVSGLLIGIEARSFFPSIVVAAALMLWLQPARDWFDGKTPAPVPQQQPRTSAAQWWSTQTTRASTAGPLEAPRPTVGTAPAAVGPAAEHGVRRAGAGPRPVQLVWACVITWAASGLAAAVLLVAALALAVTPPAELDRLISQNPEIADSGFSSSMVTSICITAVVLAVWSLGAAAMAFGVWHRKSWAYPPLVVSAVAAGIFCLGGSLAMPLLVLPLTACATTVVLLLRENVRSWVRAELR